MLSILQCDARSLIINGQEFKQFVEEQANKPNIICVQDSWFKPTLDFIVHGYTAVHKDRTLQ